MKTPKEKAEQLISEFKNITENSGLNATFDYKDFEKAAVRCAKLAVEKIIENFEGLHKPEYCAFDALGEQKYKLSGDPEYRTHKTGYEMKDYWQQVKEEIQLL